MSRPPPVICAAVITSGMSLPSRSPTAIAFTASSSAKRVRTPRPGREGTTSHVSGTPFRLQSVARPAAISAASSSPFALQSAARPEGAQRSAAATEMPGSRNRVNRYMSPSRPSMDECATGGMFHEDSAKARSFRGGWGGCILGGMRDPGRRSLPLAAVFLGTAFLYSAGAYAGDGGPPAGADWWSLRPLSGKEPPAYTRWIRNGIDAFVLSELERRGLEPSPEADRRTLIRRLSYDLVGLPPTPEDVERFVADGSARAY